MSGLTMWALGILFDEEDPAPEDVEMASAIYDRNFDVQMGTTKGPRGGCVPLFPQGRPRRSADELAVSVPPTLGGIDWEES